MERKTALMYCESLMSIMGIEENNPNLYYTIKTQSRAELKIKRSKFVATAIPVRNKEEAMAALGTVRTEFHDARHNCFAYRFGNQGLEFRSSDDGEPSGSAGKPILFSLSKFGVRDLIVVVTRYFGGIKLGVGGLARAYSGAAELALAQSIKKAVHLTVPVKVFCTYEDVNVVKKLVIEHSISFEESYFDSVEYTAHIPKTKAEQFSEIISIATNARAGTVIQKES
ncbi:MAG: YigZ family protein [Chlorobi bacterium]|nr:YigZ family protein [Chlorobiota bacterium]